VVFQDPYHSLNPARRVGDALSEPLIVNSDLTRRERERRVVEMLGKVGLLPEMAERYPAQFSGGQRQRMAIARTLGVAPELIICDEPLSALDLSIQAQVLNLLIDLQRDSGVSYLFISHDLGVVRYLADRTVVLYQGVIMEIGPAAEVGTRPNHPYSRRLLEAVLMPDPAEQRARRTTSPTREPGWSGPVSEVGCPFAPRCPVVEARCTTVAPPKRIQGESTYWCHHESGDCDGSSGRG
jgi:peptide/nickel transport system ATP-binding protein